MSETTLNHEKIHLAQQRELWIIVFYLLYVYYWLHGRVSGMTSGEAYMAIPFEREAYQNETEKYYLVCREKHSWKKYLKKTSQS